MEFHLENHMIHVEFVEEMVLLAMLFALPTQLALIVLELKDALGAICTMELDSVSKTDTNSCTLALTGKLLAVSWMT